MCQYANVLMFCSSAVLQSAVLQFSCSSALQLTSEFGLQCSLFNIVFVKLHQTRIPNIELRRFLIAYSLQPTAFSLLHNNPEAFIHI